MNGGGTSGFGGGRGYAGWGREFWRTAVGGLILANIGMFLLVLVFHLIKPYFLPSVLELSLPNLKRYFFWTIFSYQFLHANFFHILMNMIGLYFFGIPLEGRLGPKKFLLIYFSGAVFAGLTWTLISLISGENYGLIGASGAVMAAFACFCNLMGNRPINVLLFFFIPLRISPVALFRIAFFVEAFSCLFFEVIAEGSSGVAFSAHLGGLITGYVAAKIILREWPSFKFSLPSFELPQFLRKKTSSKKSGWQTPVSYKINFEDPSDRAREIDRILDKINARGFSSLTDEERQTLKNSKTKGEHF